ncbi:tetratricopeptide repeat protein [Tahibacter soli]|jgi:tetratricopeptide (TPR) repeat protein|uniref:Tetratricopeptide repeat protein n=1 Tax=Tahibacter soli TaxID=2983605 RepID=A0A9X3YJI8_9GAMM|nr:tetratricopeptide repeat protein [Tahibacter soli]MDC8013506.1 tetratricopeptide repeat protein [Tahibacter soli]
MKFTRIASALILSLAATAACAESALKPLPEPNLGQIDKAQAEQLTKNRADFEKARKDLIGPPLAQAYAMMASSYYAAGFPDIAAIALDNAVVVVPEDGRWIYLQGVLANARKQQAAARDYFERAFLVDKSYLPIRIALATALIEQGNLDRARQITDDGVKDFGSAAKLHAMRAEIALKQKRYADALSASNEALKLDPDATSVYALQADAYQAQGNASAAQAARAKAGNTPPVMGDPLAQGFLGGGAQTAAPDESNPIVRASRHIAARQYDEARKELDAALKQAPGDIGVLGLYARTEALAGNRSAAASRAAEALRAAPNDAQAFLTRGVVNETAGDEEAARRDYESAIRADPNAAEARLLLGNYLMRKAQYGQAVEQYRQILVIDPQRFEVYGHIVGAQVANGRCAESLKELNDGMRGNQRQGFLAQVFVRVASTCPAANDTERSLALDIGRKLYVQRPMPQVTEAFALAAAAAGKFDDAVQLQGGAIFAAVRDGGTPASAPFQEFFKQFQAKQKPERPWPSTSPFFKPERLQPAPALPAQPAAAKPAEKPAG